MTSITGVLYEHEDVTIPQKIKTPEKRKLKLVWRNIVLYFLLHLVSLYSVYLIFTSAKLYTTIFAFVLYHFAVLGVTAGAHRLWSHRSYKVKLPLQVLLVAMQTLAFQNSGIEWARDHRLHHKYSESIADPYDARRGMFFAHIGWLFCRKQPEVIQRGREMDVSDLYGDPVLAFQHKHYLKIMPIIAFIIPTFIPMIFWEETYVNAFMINLLRFVCGLNAIWLINSIAHHHLLGDRPYDKFIQPSENLIISVISLGEGWHNYHHAFPWDYKTSELGKYSSNLCTGFIDFFSKIGWAYDLKTVSADMIKRRVKRTGDGSHHVWGWGDKDQPAEDYKEATIMYKKD